MRVLSDAIARLVQAREHLADIADNPIDFNVSAQVVVDIKAMIQHIDQLTLELARTLSRPN